MDCPASTCGRAVAPGWVSCAHCGQRLDDASRQGEVCLEDEHEFVIEGPHCVRCGFHPEHGDVSEQVVRSSTYVVLIAACFLLALFAGAALPNVRNKNAGRLVGVVVSASIFGMGYGIFKMRRIR